MPLGGFAPLPLRLGGTPQNGLTAEQFARMASDLAAIARSSPFARMTYSGAPVIEAYTGWNGIASAFVAGVTPTPTIVGVGHFIWTWPVTYLDEYQVVHHPFIRHARATIHGAAAGYADVQIDLARSVRVRSFLAPAAPAALRVSLKVW